MECCVCFELVHPNLLKRPVFTSNGSYNEE